MSYVYFLIAYLLNQHPNVVFKTRVYLKFFKFSHNCLWNFSANCWFDIISLFIATPYQKIYKQTMQASPSWYPPYFWFLAVLNALSHNTLSETVLLGKSF